jgi:hypothetical protein
MGKLPKSGEEITRATLYFVGAGGSSFPSFSQGLCMGPCLPLSLRTGVSRFNRGSGEMPSRRPIFALAAAALLVASVQAVRAPPAHPQNSDPFSNLLFPSTFFIPLGVA